LRSLKVEAQKFIVETAEVRTKERMTEKYTRKLFTAALLAAGAASGTIAWAQAAQTRFPAPGGSFTSAPQMQLPPMPRPAAITPNGEVVEDVIVRVNDQIITRSELERSQQQLLQEAQQNNLSSADLAQRQKDLLRDMIDQQLLLAKGKELGITGDAETIRRLDEIRKQYHLDSLEALEKAATQQGVSFEDFKSGIRNNVITQQVVRDDVGRSMHAPRRAQEEEYYAAHAKDFEQPESIHLSEILVPTPDNAADAVVNQAQAKAEDIAAQLKAGAKFADLAKKYSGDASASRGGDLGDFKRGQLGKVLEDATFPLPVGGVTAPIRTRQGFVILRADGHTAAGVPPLSAVEPQVQEALYLDALQPALRAYLTKARDEAFVDIKPGFVDSGSAHKEVKPDMAFTTYTPPKVKKKTEIKKRLEAQKDAAAQQRLAEARANAAEKAAARAAKASGTKNVSKSVKVKKVRREKIRFGQAPRNALPAGPAETAQGANEPLGGQAPGVAMAAPDASSTITTGTGVDADNVDPLAPKTEEKKKTRYTARQADIELAKAQDKAVKAREHIATKPVEATKEENVAEKAQAAPLGLKGDTTKKKPKPKRAKGAPKERLQTQPVKPVDTSTPIAPTVNPKLGGTVEGTSPQPVAPQPSSDKTVLPPTDPAPAGSVPAPQPGPLPPADAPSTPPQM
jgi:peptidyl-prolyl cis-trans isomerase SurA